MNKKRIIIFVINLLSVLLILFLFEFVIYNFILYEGKNKLRFPDYSLIGCIDSAENQRNFYHEEYTKPPIWLMGCSYAWGYLLDDDKTFAEKISNLTKRPVYNWSWCGIGPAEALIRLYTHKNDEFIPKKPPEYVIYIYMYNHPARHPCNYNILYALKEFNVIDEKNTVFDRLYFIRSIRQNLFNKYHDYDKFMKQIFRAMIKETKKKYPDSKFVILIYSDTDKDVKDGHPPLVKEDYDMLNSDEFWEETKKDGAIIIKTKDLIGRDMDRPEDRVQNDKSATPHPSSEAWDLIVPKLAEKLSM